MLVTRAGRDRYGAYDPAEDWTEEVAVDCSECGREVAGTVWQSVSRDLYCRRCVEQNFLDCLTDFREYHGH